MRTTQHGRGIEAGGSVLPTIITHEPEELAFDWDTSVPEGDFAWRLTPFGRLDIENSGFDIQVLPFASEGYDEVDYHLGGELWCDETSNGDSIHLDRDGDAEGRCGAGPIPESIWFRTLGSGTAGATVADAIEVS